MVPAYQESAHIGDFLSELTKQAVPIVVVDDGSKDETAKVVNQHDVKLLSHKSNRGKGTAMQTGAQYALDKGAQAIIFMDGDGQHSPKDLGRFVAALDQGNNIVLGVRHTPIYMSLARRFGNSAASIMIWLFYGVYIPDIPSGFKAMTKSAYTKLAWSAAAYEVELEIGARIAREKLDFVCVPIETIYTAKMQQMQFLDVCKAFLYALKFRFTEI